MVNSQDERHRGREQMNETLEKYQVIYVDPPWKYKDKANAGKRGAEFKYPCLSLPELISFEANGYTVYDMSAEDSACFMWTTGPMMPDAFKLLASWGFAYKNIVFTWVKTTKTGKEWHMGMGHYTRSNPEFVLLGVRGRMADKRVCRSVHSVVKEPIGRHSAKPATIRNRIVELFGDIPRIELFARDRVPGWHADGLDLLSNENGAKMKSKN